MALTTNEIEQAEFKQFVKRLKGQVDKLSTVLHKADNAFRRASASFTTLKKAVEQ